MPARQTHIKLEEITPKSLFLMAPKWEECMHKFTIQIHKNLAQESIKPTTC